MVPVRPRAHSRPNHGLSVEVDDRTREDTATIEPDRSKIKIEARKNRKACGRDALACETVCFDTQPGTELTVDCFNRPETKSPTMIRAGFSQKLYRRRS
jgi:hypothetical protein